MLYRRGHGGVGCNGVWRFQMSNRILILPRIHCKHRGVMCGPGCKPMRQDPHQLCNVLPAISIRKLDKSGIPYRESVFRQNPLVPSSIRTTDSPVSPDDKVRRAHVG